MNWVINYLYGLWEWWIPFTLIMGMLISLYIIFSIATFAITLLILLYFAFVLSIGIVPIWKIRQFSRMLEEYVDGVDYP